MASHVELESKHVGLESKHPKIVYMDINDPALLQPMKFLDTNFVCPICYTIPASSIETIACGHIFCKACANKFWCNPLADPVANCPKCQRLTKIRSSLNSEYTINTWISKCTAAPSCQWIGSYSDLKNHVTSCSMQMGSCKNCSSSMVKHELALHIADFCLKRPMICQHCQLQFSLDVLTDHVENKCLQRPVSCINADCKIQVKKSEIVSHMSTTCLFQKIKCIFGCIGIEIERRNMSAHYRDPSFCESHASFLERMSTNVTGCDTATATSISSSSTEPDTKYLYWEWFKLLRPGVYVDAYDTSLKHWAIARVHRVNEDNTGVLVKWVGFEDTAHLIIYASGRIVPFLTHVDPKDYLIGGLWSFSMTNFFVTPNDRSILKLIRH